MKLTHPSTIAPAASALFPLLSCALIMSVVNSPDIFYHTKFEKLMRSRSLDALSGDVSSQPSEWRDFEKWIHNPYIQAEILAMVCVVLQYLQFIICRLLRRRTNHWAVRCGSWVAYYMPMLLAACAVGMMVHLDFPFLLCGLFFSVGQSDTMANYSLGGDPQGLRRFLKWAFSFFYVIRFVFACFGALSYKSGLTLLFGFLVFFMGLLLQIITIPSSVLSKITVGYSEEESTEKSDCHSTETAVVGTCRWQGINYVAGVGSLTDYESAVSGCTTVEEIGKMEPSCDFLVNDTCLSSSLFHQLVQNSEFPVLKAKRQFVQNSKFPVLKAKRKKNKILHLITNKMTGHQLHEIVEVQLSFLYEYFFVAHSSSSRTYHLLYLNYSFLKLCFLFILLLSVHSVGVATDGRVGSTIILALVCLEIFQGISIFASEWFLVSCACNAAKGVTTHYTTILSKWWIKSSIYMDMLAFKFKLFGKSPWRNMLGQYSVMEDSDCNSMKQKLMGLLGRPQRGTCSSPVALSHEVIGRAYGAIKLINYDKGEYPSWSCSPTPRTGVLRDVSWSFVQPTEIHTILIWHIATWYCIKADYNGLPYLPDRVVADELSNYCAYLVAFHPDLLRGHPVKTRAIFDDLLYETKVNLKEYIRSMAMADRSRRMSKLGEEVIKHAPEGIHGLGIKLGIQMLRGTKRDRAKRWKLMADFWAETIVFVAQSNNKDAHIDRLANGGEFITHLWALLTAAGIQQFGHKYFQYKEDSVRSTLSYSIPEIEGPDSCGHKIKTAW